jgi:hypothetical protein
MSSLFIVVTLKKLNMYNFVGFKVFSRNGMVFWAATSFNLKISRLFGGIYRLHYLLSACFFWILFGLIFDPEDGLYL